MYYDFVRVDRHIQREGTEADYGFSTLPDTFIFNILSDSTDEYACPPPRTVAAQRITLTFIPLSFICLFTFNTAKFAILSQKSKLKTSCI